MVDLDKKMMKYLKQLSRIALSQEEEEQFVVDLQNILTYAEQLQEVDTENVPPCNHVLEGMVNVTREDQTEAPLPREVFLENAPDQIGGMIKVPPVVKKTYKE